MALTQQEKWGLNHRAVAENIVIAVRNQPERIYAIQEVMDALDYIWNQGRTAGILNPPRKFLGIKW